MIVIKNKGVYVNRIKIAELREGKENLLKNIEK